LVGRRRLGLSAALTVVDYKPTIEGMDSSILAWRADKLAARFNGGDGGGDCGGDGNSFVLTGCKEDGKGRTGRSGSESGGELHDRAAYRTVWRHFVRSDGELHGRAANQSANYTAGRNFDRSGGELDGRAANWTVGQQTRR
jgi:hypothetical protein